MVKADSYRVSALADSSFHERSQTSSASVIHRLPSGRFRTGGCISQPVKAATEEAFMSTTTASSRTPSVRWLIESRPPSLTWLRPTLPPSNQPPLDLSDHEIDRAEITRLNDRGVRVSTVRARWAARPRRGLPDAQQWSGALALAVIQTLLGQRPVAQATLCKRDLAQSETVSFNAVLSPLGSRLLSWPGAGYSPAAPMQRSTS